jgi:hypothetical protein
MNMRDPQNSYHPNDTAAGEAAAEALQAPGGLMSARYSQHTTESFTQTPSCGCERELPSPSSSPVTSFIDTHLSLSANRR